MIDGYDWAGGHEAMLRFGPANGPVVVVAMPLLEEWNRTRAFVVSILRRLADAGIASALPDLPGQGESLHPLAETRLENWRHAFSAACARAGSGRSIVTTLSIRGGALIEQMAPIQARWRLAPSTGQEVARELARLEHAGEDSRRSELTSTGNGMESLVARRHDVREIAGNRVHRAMLEELGSDEMPALDTPIRVVRLESDPRPADRKMPGRPVWRASEPQVDAALADALARDLHVWMMTCAV